MISQVALTNCPPTNTIKLHSASAVSNPPIELNRLTSSISIGNGMTDFESSLPPVYTTVDTAKEEHKGYLQQQV